MNGNTCQSAAIVALVTGLLLLIPLIAMQITGEVDWDLFDFTVAAVLLFGTGFMFVLAARKASKNAYPAAIGFALATVLLLVWMNLAVGVIGNEGNPANLMYIEVLAIGIIGAFIARLHPDGLARAMFATALAQTLVALIAMILGLGNPVTGQAEILLINGFFVALWVGSALMFRYAAREQTPVTAGLES